MPFFDEKTNRETERRMRLGTELEKIFFLRNFEKLLDREQGQMV